ncbi:hypothetical protein FRC10_000491, partial [Ceratobasidium sp. 414]
LCRRALGHIQEVLGAGFCRTPVGRCSRSMPKAHARTRAWQEDSGCDAGARPTTVREGTNRDRSGATGSIDPSWESANSPRSGAKRTRPGNAATCTRRPSGGDEGGSSTAGVRKGNPIGRASATPRPSIV